MVYIIEITNTKIDGFEAAIRGMRNPLNSHAKSDSGYDENGEYKIGENDLSLMKKLLIAGSDHRKYLRYIVVSMDILAPLYWWKEFDTYKVGTVANSCSTMHTIHKRQFSLSDFSIEESDMDFGHLMMAVVRGLNQARDRFLATKDKKYWYTMVQYLPSSYNQRRTVLLNYEVLIGNIYRSRENHKLNEWHIFCDWIKTLPYATELIRFQKGE